MTHLRQKNVNSIQFEKEIVHVNDALISDSLISKEKSLEDCSSVDRKRIVKLQNFGIHRNLLGSFWKSSEIVGSFSKTDTPQDKKISRLWLKKSWQVYTSTNLSSREPQTSTENSAFFYHHERLHSYSTTEGNIS